MKTIIEDICDIISTIMPDEEEIKIYKQRCDNIFFADMLLTGLKRQYKRFEQYKEEFNVTDEMMDRLKAMGEKENVEFDEKQFDQSKRLIRLQIKALIARDVWEDQCYYEIMNEENDALKKALEVLSTEGLYENALKRK